jgi:hypothetical protein
VPDSGLGQDSLSDGPAPVAVPANDAELAKLTPAQLVELQNRVSQEMLRRMNTSMTSKK